jgi:hypothetical protein
VISSHHFDRRDNDHNLLAINVLLKRLIIETRQRNLVPCPTHRLGRIISNIGGKSGCQSLVLDSKEVEN